MATSETAAYAVKDFIDPERLRADLDVDTLNLSFSMERQAGLFSYYSAMAAKAQQQLDQMEQLESIVTARLDKKVRDQAAAAGTKITEAQVKAQICLDPKAIKIRTAVNKARMICQLCKSSADSFRHRRDMLIQLAFNGREEKKGELRVMEERQQAGRELRRQRLEAMHQKD